MVVKIQIPLTSSELFPMALITSQDGTVRFHVPLNAPLRARMNQRSQAYFEIKSKTDQVEIGDEVLGEVW